MSEQLEGGPHIAGKDRVATLVVIWTKQGQVHTSYPVESHLSIPMIALALEAVSKKKEEGGKPDALLNAVVEIVRHLADIEKMQFKMAQDLKANQPPAIIPAAGKLPVFDPKYLKKMN